MKFFGEFTLHDAQDDCGNTIPYLWKLHNPVDGSDRLWGVELDDGTKVVPCDNFVTDLSSSWIARGIYPAETARRAAVYHDFAYRAHKYSDEELMIELKPWFLSMGWARLQMMEYIFWLKNRTRQECDKDYFILSELDKVVFWKRYLAWKVISVFGYWTWRGKATGYTKAYRVARSELLDTAYRTSSGT